MITFKGLFLLFNRSFSSLKGSLYSDWLSSSLIRKKGKLAKITTRCHSLSLVSIRCLSLSFVVPFVVTRWTTLCHSLYHSLSFVVTRCHLLSLVVLLVVIRCHSMYHLSVFLQTISRIILY